MFEELNNDIKIIKQYFMEKTINVAVDAFYQSDEALEGIKGVKDIACVFAGGNESKKYQNVLCNKPLDAIEDKSADCIILRNASYKIGNPKDFLKTCAEKLKDDGYFVLCAIVTDKEDAYLNTIKFNQDRNHVRFYNVAEIIDFTGQYFRLEFYKNVEQVISLNTWLSGSDKDIDEVRANFEKFPENIKKDLKFTYGVSGDLLGFTLKTGLFIFKLLP